MKFRGFGAGEKGRCFIHTPPRPRNPSKPRPHPPIGPRKPPMLTVSDLTYRVAGRELLEATGFSLPAGHHAGLVGRNGSGKSTLLKIISGDLHADSGTIEYPRLWRMGMLAQEAPSGPESLLETVLAADTERSALLAEAETAHDPHR